MVSHGAIPLLNTRQRLAGHKAGSSPKQKGPAEQSSQSTSSVLYIPYSHYSCECINSNFDKLYREVPKNTPRMIQRRWHFSFHAHKPLRNYRAINTVTLLRGTMAKVKRTYGTPKNLYIHLFFLTKFGPINYGPLRYCCTISGGRTITGEHSK